MRKTSQVALVLTGLAIPVCMLTDLASDDATKSLERLVAYALGAWTTTLPTIVERSPSHAATNQAPPPPVQRLAWQRPSTSPEASTPTEVASTESQRPDAVATSSRRPIHQVAGTPGPTLDAVALARELQRELSRTGCYSGQISGLWTPLTRRAMQEFMRRANASLPIEKPDEVLLALVRSFPGRACGVMCAPGESLSSAGQCVAGVVARGASTPPSRPAGSSPVPVSTIRAASTPAPLTTIPDTYPGERMSLAGPKSLDAVPPATARRTKHGERPAHRARTARSRPFGPWIFSDGPMDSPFR
jgi:hypothetical protein